MKGRIVPELDGLFHMRHLPVGKPALRTGRLLRPVLFFLFVFSLACVHEDIFRPSESVLQATQNVETRFAWVEGGCDRWSFAIHSF